MKFRKHCVGPHYCNAMFVYKVRFKVLQVVLIGRNFDFSV